MTSLPLQNDEISQIRKVKELVDKGCYKDAYQIATGYWGKHHYWDEWEQLNLLSRILRGLGRRRSSDFIDLQQYRKRPVDSRTAVRWLLHSTSVRGANECYEIAQSWLDRVDATESEIADWLVVKAIILMNVRDFTQAYSLLDKAARSDNTKDWATRVKISALESEGRREEAFLLAKHAYESTNGELELERYAELLKISEGIEPALKLLAVKVGDYQSVSLWNQIAGYYFDIKNFDESLKCLEKAEALQILGRDKFDEFAASIRYQIALEKRELLVAREALIGLKNGFATQLAGNLSKCETLKPVVKLPVPHIIQKHMTCAPSSIAAIARYWGENVSEDEIAAQICFDGTEDKLQRQWLEENGFYYVDFDLSIEAANELLTRKVPFTLVTTNGLSSHLQVVTGIDQDSRILYLMDPSQSSESMILIDEICRRDALSGPKCCAIVPKDKSYLITEVELPARDLHLLSSQFKTQIERNDLLACRQLINSASQLDPVHRITVQMRRSLAIALNDEKAIASYTDILLMRFPNTVHLVLSKYYSLKTLEGHGVAYRWLRKQYEDSPGIDLFNMLLEDIAMSEDSRGVKRTLLKRKAMWTNATFFWLEGHSAWREGDKPKAAMYYFWALCLEPGNMSYLRSYFLAYLDLGKVDEALNTLNEIYESSIHVNSNIAYSLYRAYCLSGRDHLGLDALENACKIHANDSVLAVFYLQELSEKGQWARFDREYAKYASALPEIEQKKIAARNYFDKGNNLAAVDQYKALLKLIPGDTTTMEQLIAAYNRSGLNNQAEEFLDSQRELLGDRLSVLNLIVENSKVRVKRVNTLIKLVELYPAEFGAQRELAYHHLSVDDLDAASSIYLFLAEKDSTNVDNMLLKAEICIQEGNWSEAKALTKTVIKLSPNHNNAFHMLMRTHGQPDEKKEVLRNFARILEEIPNADDGVWNFWQTSKHWFTNGELRAFCDTMIEKHGDNWCVWVVSAYQKESVSDIDGAIHDLDKAAEIAPLIARVFVEKGRLMSLQGREKEASDVFEYATTLAPGWDYVAIEFYKHCERYSEIKSGLAILERCKRFNDSDAVLRGYIAECYYSLGRIERALELLVEAIERMFDYPWAWEKLRQWSVESGDSSLWKKMLSKQQEEAPDNVDTWTVSAKLSSDDTERQGYLSRAIEIEPTHLEANKQMIELLVTLKEEQQAVQLIHHCKWGKSAPISIAIQECYLLFGHGKYKDAVNILEELLTKSPRYIEGWLQLLRWAKEAGDSEKAIYCAEQLEAIAGNDAESMYEVGLFYERFGDQSQQDKVLSLYERSLALSPDSATAAFSLLDRLIFVGHHERAWMLAEKMDNTFEIPWIDVRRLELSTKGGRGNDALKYYEKIVQSQEEVQWLYQYPLEIVNEFDKPMIGSYLQVLQTAIQEKRGNKQIAESLAYGVVNKDGVRALLEGLDSTNDPVTWNAFCDSYIEYCIENEVSPKQSFWEKYEGRILGDIWLSGQAGYLLLKTQHLYQAKAHYLAMGILDRNDIPGYVYYHCALACSDIRDFELFDKVITKFPETSGDNCYDNGMIWFCFNQVRKGESPDEEILNRINTQNLSSWELSTYLLLKVALKFKQIIESKKSFSVNDLTLEYSSMATDMSPVQDVKKSVIEYIVSNAGLTLLKRTWLKTRLHLKLR